MQSIRSGKKLAGFVLALVVAASCSQSINRIEQIVPNLDSMQALVVASDSLIELQINQDHSETTCGEGKLYTALPVRAVSSNPAIEVGNEVVLFIPDGRPSVTFSSQMILAPTASVGIATDLGSAFDGKQVISPYVHWPLNAGLVEDVPFANLSDSADFANEQNQYDSALIWAVWKGAELKRYETPNIPFTKSSCQY